ncbi:MAG: NfeD family protein [Oscillospiraceae bacterium]|nr:NfeD family protein [Oscillospiraceae bacterium]
MEAWWENLGPVLQVLYCIAIPSTLVLVLQMILSMMGGESDGGIDVSDTSGLDMPGELDVDVTFDADAGDVDTVIDGGNPADFGTLKFLTLQTIVTFLTVFGWVSIACVSGGMSPVLGIVLGAVCGLIMMFIVAKLVQVSARLAEDGTLNMKNAIGETATVYLTIPAKGSGEGKVTMQLQGRFCEIDAVNEGEAPIETGAQVLVTDVLGDTLVVERTAD